MLAGLSAWHAEHAQVVVVGPADREDTVRLRQEVARHYRPFAVEVPAEPGARQEGLAALMPFVGPMRMRDDQATAYVCRGFVCKEAVTTADALAALY